MGSITKPEKQIIYAMCALQIVLYWIAGPLITALVPPALAALPMGYAALGNEQTIKMLKPRLLRAYVSSTILGIAVAAWFILAGNEVPFKLEMARLLLADVAILWFATAVAIDFGTRENGSLAHRS